MGVGDGFGPLKSVPASAAESGLGTANSNRPSLSVSAAKRVSGEVTSARSMGSRVTLLITTPRITPLSSPLPDCAQDQLPVRPAIERKTKTNAARALQPEGSGQRTVQEELGENFRDKYRSIPVN